MATVEIVPKDTLVKARKDGNQMVSPLQLEVDILNIVDAPAYVEADSLLTKIKRARKNWEDRMEPIIRPIREGLDLLYALNRDVDRPLGALETQLKDKMKAFKAKETLQLRAAEEARQREERRLAEIAVEAAEAGLRAKTNPMRERLAQKRAEAEQQLAEVQDAPAPEAVKIKGGGNARKVLKWRATNRIQFIRYALDTLLAFEDSLGQDGQDLSCLLSIDTVQMDAFLKLRQAEAKQKKETVPVGSWMPGIEIYEDISISGRS